MLAWKNAETPSTQFPELSRACLEYSQYADENRALTGNTPTRNSGENAAWSS